MGDPVDTAVRSVRIAATLHERFAVLMNRPLMPGQGMSELELKIGEAQQIYPEIWNHLDDARKTLAGRGVSTTSYDTVRALEPKGSIGVSRVDVVNYSTSLTTELLGITDEQVKTAQFNREGYQRAQLAIRALEGAMPTVDWLALARAESSDAAKAAGSLSPINERSLVKWLVVGGGALLLVYLFWYFVVRTEPRDYSAERQKTIAELRAKLDAAPCDNETLSRLTNEEYWETKERDHSATIGRYQALCEKQLDATPCDRAKQTQLRAIAGQKAANVYRDKCKASTATVPP
jgi:hypothetical protein